MNLYILVAHFFKDRNMDEDILRKYNSVFSGKIVGGILCFVRN